MKSAGFARSQHQLDFWPELASSPMVAVARLVGSRAKHRSASEERSAVPASRQAPPIGNHGDNDVRARASAVLIQRGRK